MSNGTERTGAPRCGRRGRGGHERRGWLIGTALALGCLSGCDRGPNELAAPLALTVSSPAIIGVVHTPGLSKAKLFAAIRGHVLAKGRLIGRGAR